MPSYITPVIGDYDGDDVTVLRGYDAHSEDSEDGENSESDEDPPTLPQKTKKRGRVSSSHAATSEALHVEQGRPLAQPRRTRARPRTVQQNHTSHQPHANDEEADGDSDVDDVTQREDAEEHPEVTVDTVEAFRREHRSHLVPRGNFKLANLPSHKRCKPSAFKVIQVGDSKRDELRGRRRLHRDQVSARHHHDRCRRHQRHRPRNRLHHHQKRMGTTKMTLTSYLNSRLGHGRGV